MRADRRCRLGRSLALPAATSHLPPRTVESPNGKSGTIVRIGKIGSTPTRKCYDSRSAGLFSRVAASEPYCHIQSGDQTAPIFTSESGPDHVRLIDAKTGGIMDCVGDDLAWTTPEKAFLGNGSVNRKWQEMSLKTCHLLPLSAASS